MLKVSIIVAIYNIENELKDCLNSLKKQTYTDLEVLMVDDGSTDNSSRIARKFASNDSRFIYLRKKNGGLSDARNYGLDLASGSLLMFVDGDDYLTDYAIELVVDSFSKSERLDVMLCNAFVLKDGKLEEHNKDLHILTPKPGHEILKILLDKKAYKPTVWCNVYSAEFIRKNSLYFVKGLIHEDEEWLPRVLLKAKKVIYCPIKFYTYKADRSDSIMNKKGSLKHCKAKFFICHSLQNLYESYMDSGLISVTECETYCDYLSRMYMSTVVFVVNWNQYLKLIDRNLPFKLACSLKTKIKSLIFFLSPKVYRKLLDVMS